MNSEILANEFVLKLSCGDQPGIVATVANHFSLQGFNIREASQFEDVSTKTFFMRVLLESVEGERSLDHIKASFQPIADRYKMVWDVVNPKNDLKVLVAVSQWGHCLNYLLNSWKNHSLPIEVVGVVSNHESMKELTDWYGVPFYYLPVTPSTKPEQEAKLKTIMSELNTDLFVLARYMQILSPELCEHLKGRAINIHHSFLPGFKGAKPYHQAYDRGVKIIGATAHYVTSDLDEGPIIEQAVERVSHEHTPEELVEKGRDIEAVVLQRAVRWHAENRVLLNGNKTVVFAR